MCRHLAGLCFESAVLLIACIKRCCVTTTIRECNDRGYECCLLADCTDGFDAQMVKTAMDTICAQDGLFGYVGTSDDFLAQTPPPPPPPPQLQPVVPALPDDRVLSIGGWQQLYRTGQVDILQAMNQVMDRIERYQQADPAVWISLRPRDDFLAAATALAARYQYQHRPGEQQQPLPPLFGVPFGVKDSIDVAGMPTTAACPPYAYTPSANAPAVQYLLDAGALFVGKLNLDQLATGLSGCRSPYGTPHSVYSARHISGGSSSGSAVAVGAGLVSFALATDTAGSGRVPAAFNGIVGLKPTRGTISARGLVPACPSLDTISIMAQNLDDARAVWLTVAHYDELDPYAKPPAAMPSWAVDCRGARAHGCRFAVPPAALLDAVCTPAFRDLFARAVDTLLQSGAATLVEVDYTPFQTAADLLYDGTLVYSRVAALGHAFLRHNFSALHPTTQAVFGPLLGLSPTAASAAASSEAAVIPARDAAPWMVFRDQDRQAECTRQVRALFDPLAPDSIDFLLVPTAPCHPTIEQMKADPVALNSRLGIFTHAANVVDLCAVSVNAGSLIDNGIVDGKKTELELPFGVTLLGGAGFEATILEWAGIFI